MKIKFLISFFCSLNILAQENKNLIKYHYEKKVDSLYYKFKKINFSQSGIQAYRIQIYFASTKNEINKKKLDFIDKFPNISIYLSYSSPYYKLRIGNFRNKLEAEKIKNKLIEDYPGSYIVKDFVSIDDLN